MRKNEWFKKYKTEVEYLNNFSRFLEIIKNFLKKINLEKIKNV